MPLLTLECKQGNDRRIRAALRAELAAVVARIADCPPEAVMVVIRDCEPSPGHAGATGLTTADATTPGYAGAAGLTTAGPAAPTTADAAGGAGAQAHLPDGAGGTPSRPNSSSARPR
ncbi:tautomerase family protein [Actinoallomurus spadix]|uniref:4-oxalocrotonate tautomerase n=1 Tax=Actinoallomurus spadix TaxID=79912 RepID=A0ABN0XGP9_9ACTN|nr:tautomerase family protein [Actinoallomurus spadix]MCO5988998.1 tautomerase family protein [Actinoallomurus spadix]